jgi:hypothetical protein
VQGLNLAGSPLLPPGGCFVSGWADSRTLSGEQVSPTNGCLIDFLGGTVGHLHPPARYDRFVLTVQLRGLDINAMPVGTTAFADNVFVDTWFGDYYDKSGTCSAPHWSSVGGGFSPSNDSYRVVRNGLHSWTVFVQREKQRVNESQTQLTTTRNGSISCSSKPVYYEETGPISYWFTISY